MKSKFEIFCPGDMTRYEMSLFDKGNNEFIFSVMTSGRGVSLLLTTNIIISEGYIQSKWSNTNPMTIKAALCWLEKQGFDVKYKKPNCIKNYGNRDINGSIKDEGSS